MKLNKEIEEEENMIDAVLILRSEDFHRFDCNLVLKLRFFYSCRLKYCFKRRIRRKEPCFLFGS